MYKTSYKTRNLSYWITQHPGVVEAQCTAGTVSDGSTGGESPKCIYAFVHRFDRSLPADAGQAVPRDDSVIGRQED